MSDDGEYFDFNDDDDVDDDDDDIMMADDGDDADDDELFGLAAQSSAAADAPKTRPTPHERARRLDSASTDVSVVSVPDIKPRRSYRVPAASVDPRVIRSRIDAAARNISELVGLDSDAATRLLAVFKWDADALIDAVFGNPSSTLSLLLARSQKKPKPISLAECPICYDVDCAGIELGCAHSFCNECLRTYLVQKIADEGESLNIQCPDSNCDFTVGESTVKSATNSKTYEKYQLLQIRSYVDVVPSLKWCPHPNCELAVECKVSASTYDEYFNRYANHEQSAKLDKELSEKISKKMLDMQKNSEMSWIEVQFLSTAKSILLASRNTLKWTYCFAFYLTRSNSALLFEDNQRDLEMAVEQLSELLERQFEPDKLASLKQAILDKSVYVAQRREVLLAATASDLLDARLVWSIENSSNTLSLAVPPGNK
ncbi:hypothetical protein HDU83_005981 [Entophlyctis luteolus]|nr:hypothetical protein HDU83_005981 [Entophlyctis luteolus]KAJ3380674.1 hypothetical protein HDU84_005650 [Entophlyctis sp. JEL0112]